MIVFISLFIGFIVVFLLIYLLNYFMEIEGKFNPSPKDDQILESLINNIPLGVRHNINNRGGIKLKIGNLPYITKTGHGMYFIPYNIDGVGTVRTWYKSKGMIDKIYKAELKLHKEKLSIEREQFVKQKLRI